MKTVLCSCGPVGQRRPSPRRLTRSVRHSPILPNISPRRFSPRAPPWKASANRSPCCLPTSRAMALLEDLDPEEARRIIDPALQLMMNAVHRYEGYVAQTMGDG